MADSNGICLEVMSPTSTLNQLHMHIHAYTLNAHTHTHTHTEDKKCKMHNAIHTEWSISPAMVQFNSPIPGAHTQEVEVP